MSRSARWLPWLFSLLAAVLALTVGVPKAAAPSGSGGGNVQESGPLSAAPSPGPAEVYCGELYALSEQAAGLTGSLALVGSEERPGRAREAAAEVRGLAVRAGGVEGGGRLAGVLNDLADGLEGYAGGDPAGLAAVREASEANARLRAAYAACDTKQHTDGGDGNE